MVNLLHGVRTTGISLAAVLSLGMNGQTARCPARTARLTRQQRAAPPTPAPGPTLASSWMDYVDFRRGSGDALASLGGPALAAAPIPRRHPTPVS